MDYLRKAFASKDSSDYYFSLARSAVKNEADLAEYYFCKNAFCADHGKDDSAIYYGRIALQKYAGIGEKLKALYVHNNIAKSYQHKGAYENAIQELFQGLKAANLQGHEKWQGWFYQAISLNYHDFADYARGVHYGKMAVALLKKDTTDIISVVYALNAVAINFDDWDKADSALFYHQASLTYGARLAPSSIGFVYNNIGNTLVKLKQYPKALPYINKAIALSNADLSSNDTKALYDAATVYTNLARIHYELGNLQQAASILTQAGKFAEKSSSVEKIRDYYQLGIWLNKARNNYREALYFGERYNSIRDSIFQKDNAKAIAEIEAQYQVAEKERNLLTLQVRSTRKNAWIIGLSILTIGLLAVSYLIYRQQKQRFKLRAALKEIETQHKLHQQKTMISRDLHDNIGSQLTFVISAIDTLKYNRALQSAPIQQQLSHISHFTRDTIIELRDMIWAMNHEHLSLDDLKHRLYNFIDKARIISGNARVNIEVEPELGLEKILFTSLKGINIYRSIQEALNNALKYAQASRILISIKHTNTELTIIVQDDGIGFKNDMLKEGMGIPNMLKRMEEAAGVCHINSVPGQGTTISFILPL
jgi:signal transduction histidine kinase